MLKVSFEVSQFNKSYNLKEIINCIISKRAAIETYHIYHIEFINSNVQSTTKTVITLEYHSSFLGLDLTDTLVWPDKVSALKTSDFLDTTRNLRKIECSSVINDDFDSLERIEPEAKRPHTKQEKTNRP